jgi:hypothetical protein
MASPNEPETETPINNDEEKATTTDTTNNTITATSNNGETTESTENVDVSEWESRISRSRGKIYYYNRRTKESTWDVPEGIDPSTIKGYASHQELQHIDPLESGAGRIRASHLLVKYDGSRRPSSWKEVLT